MEIRSVGLPTSTIMLVQDYPGFDEIKASAPFQGYKGLELARMLTEAGIMSSDCFQTAAIRRQIPQNNLETVIAKAKKYVTPAHKPLWDKHVLEPVISGKSFLEREIDLVRPRVVCLFGEAALFALTGKSGIKKWRGSQIRYTSPGGHSCWLVPTYSPDFILAVWKERQIAVQDLRRVAKLAREAVPAPEPVYNFLVKPSFSEVVRVLKDLLGRVEREPLLLSVDIETRAGHIACTGIAWSLLDAICIPQMVVNQTATASYWLEEEEAFITHLLYKLLTHPNARVIGQNFIYDAQYFYRWFHFIPNFYRDTMLTQHSLFSNLPKGLDYLSSVYCKNHLYWKDESKDWDPKVGEVQLWTYNCKDCVVTMEVHLEQESTYAAMSATWPELPEINQFQQDLWHAVLQTMIEGIRVNHASKARLSSELEAAIKLRQDWITDVVGYPLNPKSPQQMQQLFYSELAQKVVISRKTHSPTCDGAALERIASREPLLRPLVTKISELRTLSVFRATFIEAPVDLDDRMRCSFNIAGTETYRFSSSENAFGSGLNMQNIPKGDEEEESEFPLPNVRNLFIPDPDHSFFDIDLDSADLRIVVWESDCKEMKQMFAEGLKPYVEVAKEYYRDPSIDKHHRSYKLFKALCHGTNYLGSASGLASRIGLLAHEIERIQLWYYSKFPEIKVWQDNLKSQVSSRRYIQNVFGYRQYFFDRIEGTIFNQAVAWIPQSTVACLINRGYRNIHRAEKDIRVLLQVHDSLAGQFPTSMGDEAVARITNHCAVPLPYPEPLIIPVGIKTSTLSWGDCG